MTGFRVAPGGAQQLYGITPDLTTLGKVIGGGLPIAAYGGRRDIMTQVAPSGPIYQAGTLSGNPLAVGAGLAVIRHLQSHPEIYERLIAPRGALAACAPDEHHSEPRRVDDDLVLHGSAGHGFRFSQAKRYQTFQAILSRDA